MKNNKTDPHILRSIFSQNLEQLTQNEKSIARLCRALGVNRTQFNRFLSGNSFPRPDILDRICTYFNVDGRILLNTIDSIEQSNIANTVIDELTGFEIDVRRSFPPAELPSGFYRLTQKYPSHKSQYLDQVVWIYRRCGVAFLKGFANHGEISETMPHYLKEYRAAIIRHGSGYRCISRYPLAEASQLLYFENISPTFAHLFSGYTSILPASLQKQPQTATFCLEYIGCFNSKVLEIARQQGIKSLHELPHLNAKIIEHNCTLSGQIA